MIQRTTAILLLLLGVSATASSQSLYTLDGGAGVVDEIGRKEGFSLILLRGGPGIMYSREALDITDLVVEAFNKKG